MKADIPASKLSGKHQDGRDLIQCISTTKHFEMPQLIARLYSTKFCHLCEEAIEIVHQAEITVTVIDIAEDEHSFEKYSMRIPVLQRIDNDAELDWPFDTATLLRFLA